MRTDKRAETTERDSLLRLLSDDEISKVSTAETALGLTKDDEYLDLEHLERGVQRAPATAPMGEVLPKKAVQANTWRKILIWLAANRRVRA